MTAFLLSILPSSLSPSAKSSRQVNANATYFITCVLPKTRSVLVLTVDINCFCAFKQCCLEVRILISLKTSETVECRQILTVWTFVELVFRAVAATQSAWVIKCKIPQVTPNTRAHISAKFISW